MWFLLFLLEENEANIFHFITVVIVFWPVTGVSALAFICLIIITTFN